MFAGIAGAQFMFRINGPSFLEASIRVNPQKSAAESLHYSLRRLDTYLDPG
jgi:hypothetical protein